MTQSPPVVVLGTGPSSSKSHVCVGLARILVRRGVQALPFKAITVLDHEDDVPIPLHVAAAGVPWRREMSPVIVRPLPGGTTGRLEIDGEPLCRVHLSAPDTVDAAQLSAAHRARLVSVVSEALDALGTRLDGVLVVEGAGSPIDAVDDIANVAVLRELRRRSDLGVPRVVLSAFCRNGGSLAAIAGTHRLIPADLRELIVGYVLNGPMPRAAIEHWDRELERSTGLRRLGLAPYLPLSPEEIAARTADEQADLWADALADTRVEALFGPGVAGPAPVSAVHW